MSAKEKSQNIQKIGAWWPISSIGLLFLGAIFTVSLQQTPLKNLGFLLITLSGISILIYFIFSLGYILFTGDKSINKTLITTYLITSVLMILGGLTSSLLGYPHGLNILIIGVGTMITFWLGVFSYFLLFSRDKNLNRTIMTTYSISAILMIVGGYIYRAEVSEIWGTYISIMGITMLIIFALGAIMKFIVKR